jgi:DNA-binding response OmpR family regulator
MNSALGSGEVEKGNTVPRRSRILVVEDDPSIAMGLQINLEKDGYDVVLASDGATGRDLALAGDFQLVVLDVMLPEMNGFEVLHALRAAAFVSPVIMLSAKAGEMDIVAGLELGAVDYIAKPFSLAEFLARVRAALRRPIANVVRAANIERIGAIEVDLNARIVRRAGAPLEFTATEFDVLALLLRTRGTALTREEIFREVWGAGHHGSVRTVDNFLKQLRDKLEPNPQEPVYFLTVRGVGYRLA